MTASLLLKAKVITMKNFILFVFLAAVLLLVGCDENTQKVSADKANQPSAPQVESGRFALQKMIPAARMWSPDAQPVMLQSEVLKNTDGRDGKSGFWRSTFASPGRQKVEPFIWSGVSTPDSPKGVNHGTEDTYSSANRSMRTFDLNFLKVDTDQAFTVAQEHGGKQLMEKDNKQTVRYLLDFDVTSSQLRWHVIYGSSESRSQLTVLVDASSGVFIRKE
jgi:hypothetical protein